MESFSETSAILAADGGIRCWRVRKIFGERGFAARVAKMVESGIGGDSASPGLEIAVGPETVPIFVDAPESFHGQILGDAGVADDTDNPGVDFLLVLPEQHLEGFQVACREAFQQFHASLSISTYWPAAV